MKALTEKWETLRRVAHRLGIKSNTVYQWRARGTIPHHRRIALIRSSGGKITMADFEDAREED